MKLEAPERFNAWNIFGKTYGEPYRPNAIVVLGEPRTMEREEKKEEERPKAEEPKRKMDSTAWKKLIFCLFALMAAAVMIKFVITIAVAIKRFVF